MFGVLLGSLCVFQPCGCGSYCVKHQRRNKMMELGMHSRARDQWCYCVGWDVAAWREHAVVKGRGSCMKKVPPQLHTLQASFKT